MTDPTERLAEAFTSLGICTGGQSLYAAELFVAEGFGHREDHVPAFAEWCVAGPRATDGLLDDAERYLASLAAKEEER